MTTTGEVSEQNNGDSHNKRDFSMSRHTMAKHKAASVECYCLWKQSLKPVRQAKIHVLEGNFMEEDPWPLSHLSRHHDQSHTMPLQTHVVKC